MGEEVVLETGGQVSVADVEGTSYKSEKCS